MNKTDLLNSSRCELCGCSRSLEVHHIIPKTEYLLYRSKRKTISVEISREAKIIVRAPLKMTVKDIEAFLNSKSEWINKHLLEARKRIEEAPAPLSEDEKNKLKKRAKQFLSERVSYYAELMGVEYGSISIRAQKTRFGSCSTKKNLNFFEVFLHLVEFFVFTISLS